MAPYTLAEPTAGREPAAHHMSRSQVLKNLAVMFLASLFLLCSFVSISMLQSSMNQEQGMGVISLGSTYITFCLSAIFLPKYAIKKYGSKQMYALGTFLYAPYIAANFHPSWYTMIPTAICMGLGAAFSWGSQSTYLNDIARIYASIGKTSTKKRGIGSKYVEVRVGSSKSGSKEPDREPICDSNSIVIQPKQQPVKGSRESNSQKLSGQEPEETPKDLSNCRLSPSGGRSNLERDEEFDSLSVSASKSFRDTISNGDTMDNPYIPNTGVQLEAEADDPIDEATKLKASKKVTAKLESTTAIFFGINAASLAMSEIIGNMMTFLVLRNQDYNDHNATCNCGPNFCNFECPEESIQEPSDELKFTLIGICTCLSLCCTIVIVFFLDPLPKDANVKFSLSVLMSTLKMAKKKGPLLLIPSSLLVGIHKGLYVADFTKAYVACSWGTHHVGLVVMAYGAAMFIASPLSGWLVKKLGRPAVLGFTYALLIATSLLLLLWSPSREQRYMLFVLAAMLGLIGGVFWSQVRALYGVLFKKEEEAAFAGFFLWFSLGLSSSLFYSSYLCMRTKLYIVMAFTAMASIGYAIVENDHVKKGRRK